MTMAVEEILTTIETYLADWQSLEKGYTGAAIKRCCNRYTNYLM